MQTDQEFNDERDAYEQRIINSPRQLMKNSDAEPLIAARLPFRNKTNSFRGEPIFGLESARIGADPLTNMETTISYTSRGQSGTLDIQNMPPDHIERFYADLSEIASYRGNVYVVTSYQTVIAWTRGIAHGGVLYIPNVSYSPTSTGHQILIINAGGVLAGYEKEQDNG